MTDTATGPVNAAELANALTAAMPALSNTAAAATGLILWHETWINRIAAVTSPRGTLDPDTWPGLADCVFLERDGDGTLHADLNVTSLHEFLQRGDAAYSSTERALVAIASSLYSGQPVDLRAHLPGLGAVNTAAVMHAIAVATGHGEDHASLVEDAEERVRAARPDWLADAVAESAP
ncbi:hypothetical protein [Streptomyces sp. NPDC087300]|uniref:hypothetical protein n=1 Tax=Streptomyces sp. NPDC087300 TaxID=3365780 RepID=UPI00382E9174